MSLFAVSICGGLVLFLASRSEAEDVAVDFAQSTSTFLFLFLTELLQLRLMAFQQLADLSKLTWRKRDRVDETGFGFSFRVVQEQRRRRFSDIKSMLLPIIRGSQAIEQTKGLSGSQPRDLFSVIIPEQ